MLDNWQNLVDEVDDSNKCNNLTADMDKGVSNFENDQKKVWEKYSDAIKHHQNNIIKYKSALENFVTLKQNKTNELEESKYIKTPDLNKSRDLVEEYQRQIQKALIKFNKMMKYLSILYDDLIEGYDRLIQNLIEMAW